MASLQPDTASASVIASLYIQAIRQGQSIWFRVASGSMEPILHVDDSVYIQPVKARDLRIGEIAAFETADGLVIHRIIQRKQTDVTIRLLEMGDVELRPSWIEEQAVVGRVVAIKQGPRQIDLLDQVARRCGRVTASLRYQLYYLYTSKKFIVLRVFSRRFSRLVVHFCYWCICASSASFDDDHIEK